MRKTVHRECNLCEATCGLAIEVEDGRIVSVRGDEDDVLSRGYICAKGVAIGEIHEDPDRLRTPVRRDASGEFQPISWEDAFALVAERLGAIRDRHGRNAVGVYVGNPVVHNTPVILLRDSLFQALRTRNCFSAGSQDTSPRFVTSYFLYGTSFAVPIPDVDRSDYFLCIGANPVVSNGSFLTAPDMKGRLRAIRARGGKVVVVDPRRTETARQADEHVAILPGADAAFLLSLVAVLAKRGLVDRAFLADATTGWDEIERRLPDFAPERVAAFTGVPAETIERIALEFAGARAPVAYSRVGVCNNRFGTLATFATDLLNVATGRLGAVGGAMFPSPAFDLVFAMKMKGGDGHGRWKSRVRGLPETLGDLPAATMAEEIETPGDGQIRALVTYAGNPVLSVPNGKRLAAALGKLDFMVSIDLYVNETTRFADVILPPAWTLADEYVDAFFPNFAARNVARWAPPVVERGPGERADWEIVLELVHRLGGGPMAIPAVDRVLRFARRFGYRWTPASAVSMILRLGPHGDKFLPWSKGLNRKKVMAAPHGIDLGPLEPGWKRRVQHADGKIRLAPPAIVEAIAALATDARGDRGRGELLLVGRREVRTNNSWMHNAPSMAAGRKRCVLLVHPDDAREAGVEDGAAAVLESRVHRGDVEVRVSDEMRPGVVSLPHGWGHAPAAPWQRVAGARPGVSANDWTDDGEVEAIVGQSILNGVPVTLSPRASIPATGTGGGA